jgi:hypothetical protein
MLHYRNLITGTRKLRIFGILYYRAVPWLKQLVVALSPWRLGFTRGTVCMEFLVDSMALGQVFL